MSQRPFYQSTVFLAIIACILWATAFVGVKIGLKYSPPLQFAGIRFLISGLLILPIIKDLPSKLAVAKKHYRLILLVGLVQTTFVYALFYIGLDKVPASLGAMLIGAGPLFTALVAHFSMANDRLSVKKTAIILLGLVGVAIISLNKDQGEGVYPFLWLGIGLLLFNNIIGGIGNVLIAKYGKELSPLVFSSLSLSFGGLVLILIAIPTEGIRFEVYPAPYYLSLIWLSFLSATALSIWFGLLRRKGVKVSTLNVWKFIVPLLGAVLSWIIIPEEHPTLLAIIGMLIITLSLILFNIKKVR